MTFRAYPDAAGRGRGDVHLPGVKPETRTAPVRIELPNPDGRLKADMYADVVFRRRG